MRELLRGGIFTVIFFRKYAHPHFIVCIFTRDGRPVPRGTLPAGKGGFPAPPRAVGRGGFPAPPRPVKMIKTAGKLRGKIKARISTFSKRGNK